MSADPRTNTKTFLEHATKGLDNENLTKDDGTTEVDFAVRFAGADYNIKREFHTNTKPVDLLFDIEMPNSTPLPGHDLTPYNYMEHVPIIISCVDRIGITATKLLWKAVAELRRITRLYPTGSQRLIEEERPTTERLGSTILHSQRVVLSYRRCTTE